MGHQADVHWHDEMNLTRRDFVSLTGAAALAPFGQTLANVRAIRESGKALLTRKDLTYLGCMATFASSDFIYSGLAGRTVNGQTSLFLSGGLLFGAGSEIIEMGDTGVYSKDYRTAPQMPRLRYWGDVYQGKRQSWVKDKTGAWINQPTQSGKWYPLGHYWHDEHRMLYWGFYEPYSVSSDWWSLGCSRLNPDGTSQAYGPFRIKNSIGRVGHRSAAWFGRHANGSMLIGGGWGSGIPQCSWGPDLSGGLPFPDEKTPAGMDAPELLAPTKFMSYYYSPPPGGSGGDPNNYITGDGRVVGKLRTFKRPLGDYVNCPLLENTYRGYLDPLKAGFGSWTEIDGQAGFIWIDTPTKHGILQFATLGGNGLRKGDPTKMEDGHIFYRNPGLGNDKCAHGFVLPGDETTGPTTTAQHAAMFLINPDDANAVAAGKKVDYTVEPYDHVNLEAEYGLRTAPVGTVGMSHKVVAGYFEPLSKKLYLMANGADDTRGNSWLTPLIHVLQVNA